MTEVRPARHRSWRRWLQCVRLDEVAVLQGTPLVGFAFALSQAPAVGGRDALRLLFALVGASVCLVAHIIVLNDWAGIEGDLRDPHRSGRTFLALGVSRREMGFLAQCWAVLGLAFAACLGLQAWWVAVGMLVTSALYSWPGLHLKGVPLAGSLLHVAGGSLHFMLGYLAVGTPGPQSLLFATYFGVVFAAGHLMHEVRGCGADAANGIRTNAVVFGPRATFAAAFGLFSVAYALVALWAALEHVWLLLGLSAVAYLRHAVISWQALCSGLAPAPLVQLQRHYRGHFALMGLVLLGTFAWPYLRGLLSAAAG